MWGSSVSVQRGTHYECSCIKEASKAAAEVRTMLEQVGVSKAGIEKGVQLFNERFNAGERTFTVTFSDNGQTVTIRATAGGSKSNDTITVT